MILFVGDEDKTLFITETMPGEAVESTGYIELNAVKLITTAKDYRCIVIDVSMWSEKAEDITAAIVSAASALRCKFIIYAAGINPGSIICQSLFKSGLNQIITATNLSQIKEEFLLFLNSDETAKPTISNAAPAIDTAAKAKTIAVAGAQHHIGTTTLCFQLIKYLNSKGYKAAYIEFNRSGYLANLQKIFGLQRDFISFEGIDLLTAEKINFALTEYDYVIYDWGCISDPEFNKFSFLEKGQKIIVCGAKANEIDYSTQALAEFQNDDVSFVYEFVAVQDQEDLRELMGGVTTYFSPLIQDIFSVHQPMEVLLTEILKVSAADTSKKKKRKFGWRK